MVKQLECYTKKKKDGGKYTTCVEGQKKKKRTRRTKAQMKASKAMGMEDKPAPKVKAKPKAKAKAKAKPKAKATKKMSAGKSVLFTSGLMAKIGKARKGATTPLTIKALTKWGKEKGNGRDNNWEALYEEEIQYPAEENANESDYYGELKQRSNGQYQQYMALVSSKKKGIKRLKKVLTAKVTEGDLKMKIGGKGISKSLADYLNKGGFGGSSYKTLGGDFMEQLEMRARWV